MINNNILLLEVKDAAMNREETRGGDWDWAHNGTEKEINCRPLVVWCCRGGGDKLNIDVI